jgi:hypothetical protein
MILVTFTIKLPHDIIRPVKYLEFLKELLMRKRILILLLLAMLILPLEARAQSTVKFSQLEIDIWPEYDRPQVLVIYRITLPNTINPPVNISLRIPSSSGGPSAVASKQVDGSLYDLAYTKKKEGEWISINFTATMPEEQVEYYDPNLSNQSGSRHFVYTWPGDYEVDSLTVQVQQPYRATNMKISPNQLGNGTVRDGLTYYDINEGSVKAGQTFTISLDYQKPDDSLSAQKLQILPSAPITENTKGSVGFLSSGPWSTILISLAILLGVLLVAGGLIWYSRIEKRTVAQPIRRRRRATTAPELSDLPAGDRIVYCQQCGNRAGPDDQFCRTCGVRLRLE